MAFSGDLIKRDTVAQLVENYNDAVKDITRAYDLLHTAKSRLNTSYGLGQRIYSFDVLPHGYGRGESLRDDSLATVLKQIKLDAWRVLVERLELRKLLSIGRRSELDKQLADGKDLPEITIENVWGLFESAAANIDTYMEEAVAEVFEMLPMLRDAGLIRNILYSGVWTKYAYLQSRKEKEKKQ